MHYKDMRPLSKCFGKTTVGSHGQTVIPVEARRRLGLETGAKLLVFEFFQGRGLLLLKTDAFEELITVMAEQLSELESISQKVSKIAT